MLIFIYMTLQMQQETIQKKLIDVNNRICFLTFNLNVRSSTIQHLKKLTNLKNFLENEIKTIRKEIN